MSNKPLIVMARRAAVAVAATAALAGCATSTTGSVTGSNRSQLLLVSEAEMVQASQQAFNQRKSAAQSKGVLITSGADYNRVTSIMRRLAGQVSHFRPDAARWNWDLALIRNDEVNANVMPGGKVTVYTGLYQKLNLSDDELAAVIGHEMAHALREHSREQVSQQMAGDMALSIGGSLLGLSGGMMDVAGIAKQLTLDLPYSRRMETEADIFGLELAARAGYNPSAALTLWQKMAANGAGQGSAFFSTHPSAADRTSRIQAALPQVMPLYQAARRK